MKIFDIFFSLITGLFVAWLADSLLLGRFTLFLFLFLPVFSVFCLWLAEKIGKKYVFVHEAAKFVLVGGFADIVDIKLFQAISIFLPLAVLFGALLIKSFTFLVAVAIKYIGNKNWVFEKNGAHNLKNEVGKFLAVTAVGLIINVGVFYCATLLAPKTEIWQEINLIIAVLAAAIWNFLGYKLIVFKAT